jgi:hypothetical protein
MNDVRCMVYMATENSNNGVLTLLLYEIITTDIHTGLQNS